MQTSHLPPPLNLSQCHEPHFGAIDVGLKFIGMGGLMEIGVGVKFYGLRGTNGVGRIGLIFEFCMKTEAKFWAPIGSTTF